MMKKTYLAVAVLMSMIVSACGGGGSTGSNNNSNGVGANVNNNQNNQIASAGGVSGTVTGFGSIIVDGVRIEEGAIQAQEVSEDGASLSDSSLALGQHVEVGFDENKNATQIKVISQVLGSVTAVNTMSNYMVVAGQKVTVNTDPLKGPVTVFGGNYSQWGQINTNDKVKVFGMIVDGQIQATRIESSSILQYVHAMGKVSNFNANTKTFNLGGLSVNYNGVALDANSLNRLKENQLVAVLINKNANLAFTVQPAGMVVYGATGRAMDIIAGVAKNVDVGVRQFYLNGVKVTFNANTIWNAAQEVINSGSWADAYVRAEGSVDAAGVLKASKITLRQQEVDQQTQGVEVHGSVLYFNGNSLKVRGVDVTMDQLTNVNLAGCPSSPSTLSNDMQVIVKGKLNQNGGMNARFISCEQMAPNSIVERVGTVSSFDSATGTVIMTNGNKTYVVKGSSTTKLFGGSVNTLLNNTILVRGILNGDGSLAARAVYFNVPLF